MTYGSVCSGIEAASVAWEPLGWIPKWFSEIEKFPCMVLDYHFPSIPNLGDITKLNENEVYNNSNIDLLVGGTPCQSFSIAGLRGGLADKRGNLAFHYCRILLDKQPTWFVWENVPGVFSSYSGQQKRQVHPRKIRRSRWKEEYITETSDFGSILNAFRECGYSIAYRVFDSQYFGVPQRRRRVFVVGYLGEDWRPPAAVLFESESLRRDFTPSREKRQETTGTLDARSRAGGFPGSDGAMNGHVIAIRAANTSSNGCGVNEEGTAYTLDSSGPCHVVSTLDANYGKLQGASGQDMNHGHSHLIVSEFYSIMPMNSGKDYKARMVEVTQPLMGSGPVVGNQGGDVIIQPIPFDTTQITSKANGSNPKPGDPCHPLTRNGHPPALSTQSLVRRLTPYECELLQGFPGNYTNVPGASDSKRYKAIGNSMTRNVMHWIGKRIQQVDEVIKVISKSI